MSFFKKKPKNNCEGKSFSTISRISAHFQFNSVFISIKIPENGLGACLHEFTLE